MGGRTVIKRSNLRGPAARPRTQHNYLLIGWGLVFQGVRDFYHSKFIPAEPNFYHFNMVQSLQLLPAA
jgi:hypothetical protein